MVKLGLWPFRRLALKVSLPVTSQIVLQLITGSYVPLQPRAQSVPHVRLSMWLGRFLSVLAQIGLSLVLGHLSPFLTSSYTRNNYDEEASVSLHNSSSSISEWRVSDTERIKTVTRHRASSMPAQPPPRFDRNASETGSSTDTAPNFSSTKLVILITILQIVLSYNTPTVYTLTSEGTLHLFATVNVLCTAGYTYYWSRDNRLSYSSLLLMVCGFALMLPRSSPFPPLHASLFLGLQIGIAPCVLILIEEVHRRSNRHVHAQNTRLLLPLAIAYLTACCFEYLRYRALTTAASPTWPEIDGRAVILHASSTLATLITIKFSGAVISSSTTLVTSAMLLAVWIVTNSSLSLENVMGLGLITYGVFAFKLISFSSQESQSPRLTNRPSDSLRPSTPARPIIVLSSSMAILLTVAALIMPPPSTLITPVSIPIFSYPLEFYSLQPQVLLETSPSPKCKRRILPSQHYHATSRTNTTTSRVLEGAFDDVLLIVFFSHARYDVNLDRYRETYAAYFPNMVFVGPASREDRGFKHSYDVIVDSYHSEEDLNDPDWYKMAGRMAHHMLYTILSEHVTDEDCYKGFLWAPFDTLLNIPRLAQFPQDRIWYHSPLHDVIEYMPNPALSDSSKHAPAATISPDPYGNVSQTWRGWGADWWWGDPHVGLDICMPAYDKVSKTLREELVRRTSNEVRLIGGSCDTLYVPDNLRKTFLEVLGLFLETTCFLEIALPTALHLVLPPREKMVFVDHYWIWQPPFNTDFVRQQWDAGYEVDSFHTFHWGDVQTSEDGHKAFVEQAGVVSSIEKLLDDSFHRQYAGHPDASTKTHEKEGAY